MDTDARTDHLPKKARSSAEVQAQTMTFFYFGFNYFVQLVLRGGLKWNPRSIACVMNNSVVPEGSRHQWTEFVMKVQQDQDVVSKELQLVRRGHKVSDTAQFIHYATINDSPFYIYSFGFHCNPKRTTVEGWQNSLLSHTNFHVEDKYVLSVPCDHAHVHDYLLPFFGDNKFIEGYVHAHPDSIIKKDFVHAKETSNIAKLTDSPFVFEIHFNDNMSLWNENHFSLRLANCLRTYPIIPGVTAMYTAREGQHFGKQENSKYFLFHGSPDITLKRKVDEAVEKILVLGGEAEEESTCTENDEMTIGNAIIENKVSPVEACEICGVSIPGEISEVLANIHSVLVKALLSSIGTGNNPCGSTTLSCSGTFLAKVQGVCQCKLVMPLIIINGETRDGDGDNSQYVKVTSFMHGQLGKDNLCCHLNNLL